jgi:UDP-N-acetyl-D-glucosamine dehydrogenase
MSATSKALERKILDRSARIGIIGLGYVGLPEAVMFAQAGFSVTGFDLDTERIDKINVGESYISDVASAVLAGLISAGRLRAISMPSDFSTPRAKSSAALNNSTTQELNNCFGEQDCLCICVPTPLRKTRDPDISYIISAVEGFQSSLRPGQLVILESTTYPGTTEEVVQTMLEAGGLKAGADFHLDG